jgi:hypothetical protein
MQGTKKELTGGSKQLFIGWSEGRILSINPSLDEAEKVGVNIGEEELEYVKENNEGIDVARIDFWLEDVKNGYKYKKSFFIENSVAETKPKDGEEDSFKKKTQYVNQVGDTMWVENKKELNERFTKFRKKVKGGGADEYEIYGDKVSRIAKRGEGDLMDFVRKWMAGCDFYDVDTNILLDMKKIFAGNFKELKEQVNGQFTLLDRGGKEYPSTIVNVLEIKVVDGEEGPKEYQNVWRRSVAGWQMKSIRNTKFTRDNIAKWAKEGKGKHNPEGVRWLKDYEKLAIEISTGEYKSKNFYSLEPIHEYNSEENFVASDKAVTKEAINAEDDQY